MLDIIREPIPSYLDGKSFKKLFRYNNLKIHDYLYFVTNNQNIQTPFVFPSRAIINTVTKKKYIKNFNSIELHDPNDKFIKRFIKDNKLLGKRFKEREINIVDIVPSNVKNKNSASKNKIIKYSALSFPSVPYEEFYNLEFGESVNLLELPNFYKNKEFNTLKNELKKKMKSQNDYLYLPEDPMPLFFANKNALKHLNLKFSLNDFKKDQHLPQSAHSDKLK